MATDDDPRIIQRAQPGVDRRAAADDLHLEPGVGALTRHVGLRTDFALPGSRRGLGQVDQGADLLHRARGRRMLLVGMFLERSAGQQPEAVPADLTAHRARQREPVGAGVLLLGDRRLQPVDHRLRRCALAWPSAHLTRPSLWW